jgi:uncharacterized YigZ family protein
MNQDSYNTICKPSEGLFKDKGSKFISLAFPTSSEEEIKTILINTKKKYHDARHHCYAYNIGIGEDRFRVNDDGEPSGTAGRPIYGQIVSHNLSDILIVVIRYFGGTLLGTSGLINAYKTASLDCINKAEIIEKLVKRNISLEYNYELMSAVMKIVKEEEIEVLEQNFTDKCLLTLNVRLGEYEKLNERFKNIYGVYSR